MTNRGDSSNLSVISEEKVSARKHHESGDYECGSNHKIKSAYGGGPKKKVHPLMLGPSRQAQGKIISLHSASKNNLSEFTQRIMSAKLLRVKQVQNQLNETQLQLNELINENRILRNMQKRHEGALKRYEGNHAELPQLIRSHNEEIRTLKANNKLIKAQLRESNTKLKERENELEALRDNYMKLKKLSTEKNLLEREKLQKKVDDLQEVIKEQEEKIQVLSRKILLESKNYRHQLNVEVLKHKETQKDLNSALTMISKLESQLLAKDRPTGKVLLKRESKTVMSILSNKSSDFHSKKLPSEDGIFSREDGKKKFENSDTPESDLEILNLAGSSENTPSPTQDIFLDATISRKSNLDLIKANQSLCNDFAPDSEISSRKHINTPAPKKPTQSILRNTKYFTSAETNAKIITEKLNENMESVENLARRVEKHSSLDDSKSKLDFILNELQEKSSNFEKDAAGKSLKKECEPKSEIPEEVEVMNGSGREERRNVPKRKFEDNLKKQKGPEGDGEELGSELTVLEQEKMLTMTKTWNELKGKIKEERKKAEEKMKELNHLNEHHDASNSVSSDPDKTDTENEAPEEEEENVEEEEEEEKYLEKEFPTLPETNSKKELRFADFAADDAYILEELKKTDRVFNRLKKETQNSLTKNKCPSANESKTCRKDSAAKTTPKSTPKPLSKPRVRPHDIKSFKTESHRDPKYLEEFQSECQKQNLIKALKAIDNEREPSYSEDSADSDRETFKSRGMTFPIKRTSLKQTHKISSDKSNKHVLSDIFG